MNKEKVLRELSDWDDTTRRRKITLSNPVFIKGLALTPLAVAATTVQNSFILSVCVLLLLTPTRIVTSAVTRRMSVPLKSFFYPLTSAVIFFFVYIFMYRLFGTKVFSLGVYLPIMVVDPLIVKNFEKTRKESFTYSIINGLRNTFGFILACMITGAVREFLAFGTVCGVTLLNISLLPMAKTSFGGFIIIGLISAFWHYSVKNYRERLITEARKIIG